MINTACEARQNIITQLNSLEKSKHEPHDTGDDQPSLNSTLENQGMLGT